MSGIPEFLITSKSTVETGNEGAYTPPPTESVSPAEYVSMFFSDEMTDKTLLEANRYAMTKENKFIDVD
ncbi:hypothetical protein QYM36_008993 [Artemia franciscana]|uniref:Uncharacterized protein n=1 Tax=Artemia franciscana TaxID=6661 RepID=A0AA88HQD3_ARTSF|nr:hypothetical protein QYM36_008993 [Artemia franciscana]